MQHKTEDIHISANVLGLEEIVFDEGDATVEVWILACCFTAEIKPYNIYVLDNELGERRVRRKGKAGGT